MATLPGLRVGLTLDSATFVAETRRVNDSVNRLGRNVAQQNTQMQRGFTAVSGAVKGVVASLGALVSVAGATRLASLAKDALDAAGNLGEMATQAGVTTRQLQALQVAGVQVGVSSEQMVKALSQFGVRVGEAQQGTGELADTLERYGIATANSAGQVRSSIDILGDLANAVQRAGSEQERLSIVADAFGARVGPKLLPILTEGAAGFQKWAAAAEAAGLILDDEFIAAADRASDGIATLQFAVAKGFEIGVVQEFAGSIDVSTEALTRAREAGEALGRGVGNAIQFLIDSFASLQPFIETTRQEFNAIKNVLIDFGILAPDSIEAVNAKLEELIAKRRELSEVAEAHGMAPAETFAVAEANREIEGLIKIRDALQQQADAAAAASAAIRPLHVDIHKQAEAAEKAATETTKAAKATDELTGAQKRLAAAGAFLTKTSAQEQRFDHEVEVRAKITAEMEKQAAAQDRLADEQRRNLEAQAIEAERLLNQPFADFLSSVQSSTTAAFENIYNGGVTSFSDLFDEAKRLATRFAAELTSLLIFSPRTLLGGLGGAGGLSSLFGGTAAAGAGGAAGPISLSQPITGVPAGQAIGAGGLSAFLPILGAAGLGGAAGFGIGSSFGGQGGLGGGLGGALGAGAGFAFGGPIGAIAGGALGSVAGGLLGGLFGGGGKDKSKGTISGGLGQISASGKNLGELTSALQQFDQQIIGLLNARQREAVDASLRNFSRFVSVKGGISESDIASAARQRGQQIAGALGFNAQGVAGGGQSAQQVAQNLQTALGTQRAIEDLTGRVTAFDRATEELEIQFETLTANARRFGISLEGLAEAQTKAAADLQKAQDAAISSLLDPFRALLAPLEALQTRLDFAGLNPAEQFARAQTDFERIAAEAAGGSIPAIQQFESAADLFTQLASQVGASPGQAAAVSQVQAALADIRGGIVEAQADASRGVEDILDRADRNNTVRLDQLIEEVRRLIAETRRTKAV